MVMVFQFHSFLFADLVGFTDSTAAHGADRAADLAGCPLSRQSATQ